MSNTASLALSILTDQHEELCGDDGVETEHCEKNGSLSARAKNARRTVAVERSEEKRMALDSTDSGETGESTRPLPF
jgi:hypothetical protein